MGRSRGDVLCVTVHGERKGAADEPAAESIGESENAKKTSSAGACHAPSQRRTELGHSLNSPDEAGVLAGGWPGYLMAACDWVAAFPQPTEMGISLFLIQR